MRTVGEQGSGLAALALLLVLVGGGALWWLWSSGAATGAPTDGAGGGADDIVEQRQGDPVSPASGDVDRRPTLTSGPVAGKTMLELPDGTQMPNLNGVEAKVRFKWTNDRAYSPIVAKREAQKDGDWEWYEHGDGSLSTTVLLYRKDLGREDPTSVVASPSDTTPLDPRLAQQFYESGQLGTNPPPKK